MIFTDFGHLFVLNSDNGPCATIPGSSMTSCNSTRFTTSQAAHITHKAMDLLKLCLGFQRNWWKSPSRMENHGIMDYFNTELHPYPAPFHHHWKPSQSRKPRTSLPQIPSSTGKSVENSRICQELMKWQPAGTSTNNTMEPKPGQPVFMKEVHGNVWKTGVIAQPAKEPDSYWIQFLDSSMLGRTHSMIKPRSLPSHFELESKAKERNISEFIPSSASSSFQSMPPKTRATSLTKRQSSYTTVEWKRDIIC